MSVLNQIYNEVILAKSIDGLIIILDGPDKLKKDLKNKDVIIYDSSKVIQNGIYSTSLLLYRYIDKNDFSEGTFYFLIESFIQIIDGWKFFTTNKNILDNTGEILGMNTEQTTSIEIKPIHNKIMNDSTTSDTFIIQNYPIQVISNDNDFKLINTLKEWIKNEIKNETDKLQINLKKMDNTEEIKDVENAIILEKPIKEIDTIEFIDPNKKVFNLKKSNIRNKSYNKLTRNQIIEIKKLLIKGDIPNKKISEMFGISKTCVSDIKVGNTYKDVIIEQETISCTPELEKIQELEKPVINKFTGKLTKEQVIEIKKLLTTTELSCKEIGFMFKVSASSIWDIKNGRSWRHIL